MKRKRIPIAATAASEVPSSLDPMLFAPLPVMGFVPLLPAEELADAAGTSASLQSEFCCAVCGYGALLASPEAHQCPMCAASAWAPARARAAGPTL